MASNIIQKVIWHEGMFLTPQHFQQHERYIENIISDYSTHSFPLRHGFIRLEFDEVALERRELSIKQCLAILPDGTLVDIPKKDCPPNPIKINQNCENQCIFFGFVCSNIHSSDNKENQVGLKYNAQEIDVSDNHESDFLSQKTHPVKLGFLNLVLTMGREERSSSMMPITKIKNVIDEKIIFDDNYIPPLINSQASFSIRKTLNDLETRVKKEFFKISLAINSNKFSLHDEYRWFDYLTKLNNFISFVVFQNKTGINISPNDLYSIFFGFLNDIVLFKNSKDCFSFSPEYNPSDLSETFNAIMRKIYFYIENEFDKIFSVIKGIKIEEKIWLLDIPIALLESGIDFVVSITIDDEKSVKGKELIRHVKVASKEDISHLIFRSLPGLELEHIDKIQKGVPFSPCSNYFLITQKGSLWNKIKQTGKMVVYVGGIFADKVEIFSKEKEINDKLI